MTTPQSGPRPIAGGVRTPAPDASIVLTAPRRFEWIPAHPGTPGEDEVLVRVAETGLCGSDVTMYLGEHPVNRPPLVLGHEFHGELASGCGELRRGTRVAVFPALSCGDCACCRFGRTNLCADMGIIGAQRPGALAGTVLVPAANVVPLDERTPPGSRVLVEPLAVASHAVDRAGSVDGLRCVVLGAGTIGTLVTLLLRRRGAGEVIVVDTDDRKLDTVRLLEAGSALPARDTLVETLGAPDGGAVDVVFDCVGSASLAAQACSAVVAGGTVVLVGVQHGPLDLDGVALQRGERTVRGVQLYTRADFAGAMSLLATDPALRALPTEVLIRRNPASHVASVFDRLAGRSGTHLKETVVFE